MFTASDLGWIVGHSYILYAPLLRGCATVIFEGKRKRSIHVMTLSLYLLNFYFIAIIPDAGIFWKSTHSLAANLCSYILTGRPVIETYKCSALFTAPTALRAVSRTDPHAELMRKYNLRSLRALFLAGERSEPNIIIKYQRLLEELGAPNAIVDDK